ncbi:unnamed protein product, partial [Pylaiella littoralis]
QGGDEAGTAAVTDGDSDGGDGGGAERSSDEGAFESGLSLGWTRDRRRRGGGGDEAGGGGGGGGGGGLDAGRREVGEAEENGEPPDSDAAVPPASRGEPSASASAPGSGQSEGSHRRESVTPPAREAELGRVDSSESECAAAANGVKSDECRPTAGGPVVTSSAEGGGSSEAEGEGGVKLAAVRSGASSSGGGGGGGGAGGTGLSAGAGGEQSQGPAATAAATTVTRESGAGSSSSPPDLASGRDPVYAAASPAAAITAAAATATGSAAGATKRGEGKGQQPERPGPATTTGLPSKPSRTLADAAAFVESQGKAAEKEFADALNTAHRQEGHQTQARTVSEPERSQQAAVHGPASSSAGGGSVVGGGVNPAAATTVPSGAIPLAADRDKQLYEGDCSAADEGLGVWRQLQAPHMAFIQCQLGVLGGLVLMILICWRRHGRMISVLYAPPGDVSTRSHVADTP